MWIWQKKELTGSWIQFDFSGGSKLRLNVDYVDIVLADLGAGHPTSPATRAWILNGPSGAGIIRIDGWQNG